jgi:hypothetical protein
VHLIICGVQQQAQQLRPEQECGWVMAHENAPTQGGNRLVIHEGAQFMTAITHVRVLTGSKLIIG